MATAVGRTRRRAQRNLGNRYQLQERIAAGGMGTVYRGRDLLLRRPVAVKVIHPHLAHDPDLRRRFLREARVAARLHHPAVVAVFDHGEDGLPYIVMEYVRGRSLRAVLEAAARPLTPAQALAVVGPVSAALQRAHAAGIIHRDVKPENILVDAADGAVKVADFGIARVVASRRVTTAGGVVGTAHYLAPELVRGEHASPASDQYALGLVLFELLTGRTPFAAAPGPHPGPLPRPSTLAGVPPELDEVVARATAPVPQERYADVAALAEALRRAVPEGPSPLPAAFPVPPPVQPRAATRAAGSTRTARSPRARRAARRAARTWAARLAALTALVLAAVLFTPPPGPAPASAAKTAVAAAATVAVPAVSGLPALDAATALQSAGLEIAFGEPQASAEVAPQDVVGQDPPPGTLLRRGGTVALRLSSGPPRSPLPDVRGRDLPEAVAALEGPPFGFRVQVREVPSITVPGGRVTGQEPQAGTVLPFGGEVTLQVSRAAPAVAVPDVAGRERAEAERALTAAGLTVTFREEFSDSEPNPGEVVRHDPAAGTALPAGAAVEVTVSRGPATLEVPQLLLVPVADAQRILAEVGFPPADVVEQERPLIGEFRWGLLGLVERQIPEPRTRVPRDTVLVFTTYAGP